MVCPGPSTANDFELRTLSAGRRGVVVSPARGRYMSSNSVDAQLTTTPLTVALRHGPAVSEVMTDTFVGGGGGGNGLVGAPPCSLALRPTAKCVLASRPEIPSAILPSRKRPCSQLPSPGPSADVEVPVAGG